MSKKFAAQGLLPSLLVFFGAAGCGRVAFVEDASVDGASDTATDADGAAGADGSVDLLADLPGDVLADDGPGDQLDALLDQRDAPLDLADGPLDLRDASLDLTDGPLDQRDAPLDRRDADVEAPRRCASPIADNWKQPLTGSYAPWRWAFGDPTIDTVNQRLQLTYDDIIERAPFVDSYVVSFDLSITGNLTFFASNANTVVNLPSITRSAEDLVLATTYYGANALSSRGAFTRKKVSAPAGEVVRVTLYMKMAALEMAMKVQTKGGTFFSGFLATGMPREGLAMVGNNDVGTNGLIVVGPLQGCAAMTDAEVEAAAAQ